MALEDYAVDERGDIGSWVRMAAINSLGSIIAAFFQTSNIRQELLPSQYLPPDLYITAFAALLKQGSERLDTVRREAGVQITALLEIHAGLMDDPALQPWYLPGFDLLSSAFLGYLSRSYRLIFTVLISHL